MSLGQASAEVSGDRTGNGRAAWGDQGILHGRSNSFFKNLSDSSPSNVSGMVFPVDESATVGCWCGSFLPQLFTISLQLGFGLELAGHFIKDIIEDLPGVASVEEVSIEGL